MASARLWPQLIVSQCRKACFEPFWRTWLLPAAVVSLTVHVLVPTDCQVFAAGAGKTQGGDSETSRSENALAIFFIDHDIETNRLTGMLYPLARFDGYGYLPLNFHQSRSDRDSSNLSLERYHIIHGGKRIARFTVTGYGAHRFSCSEVVAGEGHLEGALTLKDLFDRLREIRKYKYGGSHGSGERTWTLAVRKHHPVNKNNDVALPSPDTYRRHLKECWPATVRLAGTTYARENVSIPAVYVRDLDGDDTPEVFGKLEVPGPGGAKATALVGLTYARDDPVRLLWEPGGLGLNLWLFRSVGKYSWGSGYDFIDSTDIDGDGTQEIIIRQSGYETVEFRVFEYSNGSLVSRFRGGEYGC